MFQKFKRKNNKFMRIVLLNLLITFSAWACQPQPQTQKTVVMQEEQPVEIITGAEQTETYLPLLNGKQIAMVVNHTSRIGETHLVDSLLALDVQIKHIFAPEHGFRGDAGAGEKIDNSVDTQTGLPIISLYGANRKPQPEQLAGIELVIFDIQDVGARFYTYISTMHYVMEACAEAGVPLLILDRPNPNGYYVDGPVLDLQQQSFVGMHPIPVVYGLTVGELAQMVNGEKWLENGIQCDVEVIQLKNYTHKDKYSLPVKPSPNLPTDAAVNLYPSLCFFEPTQVSIGRGTSFPFQVMAYPDPQLGAKLQMQYAEVDTIQFTPMSIPDAAPTPKHENQPCYGVDLTEVASLNEIKLDFLLNFYNEAKKAGLADDFFTNEIFFNKLAGNEELLAQIKAGKTEVEIRQSWEDDLNAYKNMRKKYLLYEDFGE